MKPGSASASLFEVYLRLRPSQNVDGERFIDIEEPVTASTTTATTTTSPAWSYDSHDHNGVDGNKDGYDGERRGDDTTQENEVEESERDPLQQQQPIPTHITMKPPSYDHRKRAVERFAFTRVFEEDASQRDVFTRAGVVPLIAGVLGGGGGESAGFQDGGQEKKKKMTKGARDGLLATLGMTGSGKTHTILGSRSQRGLTQMALDVLFQSTDDRVLSSTTAIQAELESLVASDPSEAIMVPSVSLLDAVGGDIGSRFGSDLRGQSLCPDTSSFLTIPTPKRRTKHLLRRSAMPSAPSVHDITVPADPSIAQYAIVVSMYEVYNDRIFDLLARQPGGTNAPSTPNSNIHHQHQNYNQRRRPLLFKFTEASPDRKVVAGLRKVVCSSLEEALTVLDTGLLTRKVAGTGSNAVSSRGHGFFVVEVKRRRDEQSNWTTGTLTVVDLAGSERARNAKTAGATLAEAGKINESLMYLGQCMQMQSDSQEVGGGSGGNGSRNIAVPYRQCKLTELLFSNSFVNTNAMTSTNHQGYRSSQYYGGGGIYGHQQQQQQQQQRVPQRAIMIVTADARGDFNATSQILRYSALAREVTVPRIPSVSSVIQNGGGGGGGGGRVSPTDIAYPSIITANDRTLASRHATLPSSTSPSPTDSQHPHSSSSSVISPAESESESEIANANAILRLQLTDETTRRRAAESSWLAAEQRLADAEERLAATEDRLAAAEQAVRDEMCVSLEEAVEAERRRWKGVWDEELERQDEKVDRKIEIMERRRGDDDDDDDHSAADDVFNGNGKGIGSGKGYRSHAHTHAQVDIFVDAHDHDGCDDQTEKRGDTLGGAHTGAVVTASADTAAAAAAATTAAMAVENCKIAALEQENDGLKVKVRALERAALNGGYDDSCSYNNDNNDYGQQQQRRQQPRTPSRKQRVLTARRWEADCGLGSSPS